MTAPDAPDAPEPAAAGEPSPETPAVPTPEAAPGTAEAERPAEPSPEKPAETKPAAAPKRARQPFGAFLRETYGVADPRSLGLFRIALATLLFVDVLRRWPDIGAHYANTGWLTNHFMLFRPMSDHLFSLYLACSTPGEVKTLMLFHLAVCVLLAFGWHTRVMQVLAAVLLVSINSRNIMLENGGWVVLTLLTVWSMFLPLGKRFSIDALRASLRARREATVLALNDRSAPERETRPVASFAVAALILQWIVIYYFNVVHKTGHEWRDGTAVYYFFQQDRMVTMLGSWLRDYIPVGGYKAMTYSALAMESMIALLLAAPFRTSFFRMVAWGLCCALHLSIDAVVQLGPFSWAMVTMFWALIPREAWDEWGPKLAARWPERELCFDAQSGFWLAFCRVVKRFDVLERVHFRAVTPALEEETAEPEQGEAEKEPARPGERLARAVGETLVVRDPARKKVFRGLRALLRLGDAVPFGAVLTFPARLPLLGTAIERRLERASAQSGEADAYFELEGLPGSAEVPPAEPAPVSLFLGRVVAVAREGAVLLVMVSCASQVLIENRAVPKLLKVEHRPEWMASIVIYPRLFQGWSMFAPSPPSDDGRVVVDGVTKDGRHLDPLTGHEPSFDVQPKGGFRMNQIWGDFHRRIGEQRFEGYLEGVRDMLRNYHQITHRPEDELVSFTAYFVSEHIPPPGGTRAPAARRTILSWTSDTAPSKQPQRPTRGRFHR
jgi:hypothetical protein